MLNELPRITLDQLDQVWCAKSRHDAKFVMTYPELLELLDLVNGDVTALEIEESVQFKYRTEYFDTADRDLYRNHAQNKMRRYKIRERTYLDNGLTQLEIKSRKGTSETHKHVLANPNGIAENRIAMIHEYLNEALSNQEFPGAWEKQPTKMPTELISSAITEFVRITLLRPSCGEKITIDLNLRLMVGNQSITASPDIALVEVKSSTAQSLTVSQLRHLGIRPTKFSKYASAIDLLICERPRVHARRTLAKVFHTTSQ